VAFRMAWQQAEVQDRGPDTSGGGAAGALKGLAGFRGELYRCLTGRADALFELADAVLCGPGPVRVLAVLPLETEHRRGLWRAERRPGRYRAVALVAGVPAAAGLA